MRRATRGAQEKRSGGAWCLRDPLYAMKLQEVIGGQWREVSVAMQFPFQGWNVVRPSIAT
jgi:hypothetical protein